MQPHLPTPAELRERWREVAARRLAELEADPEGVKRWMRKKARELGLWPKRSRSRRRRP